MAENVFLEGQRKLNLLEHMDYDEAVRGNLGNDIPVLVYRLLEYSVLEQLIEEVGREKQIELFRKAGYQAGEFFAKHVLDLTLEKNAFIANFQRKLEELRIGLLRIESLDEETGKSVLTISEDADCSGLPLLGETVCNYDEGFISGVVSTYTGRRYAAVEIDCWGTGDRVCRFCVEPQGSEKEE